jgi:carbon-monoxide dehydrogenase small subunit
MRIALTVNGSEVTADVAPRLHLADFLREHLRLTGTHLGCEHGVCGACTLLLDDEPARGCIAFAALCEGLSITTIEGLADDPVMMRLRAAFTAEHALQCGYCTPGMLVMARDIVQRLPDASDDEVRRELAGNLCRCTGYNGIVRAIRRVLDERVCPARPFRPPLPRVAFAAAAIVAGAATTAAKDGLRQSLEFAAPPAQLWQALRDPTLIAACVPGAALTSAEQGALRGEMLVALGPIRARFSGEASVSYDETTLSGTLRGEGRDRLSGTLLSGSAEFRVAPAPAGAVLEIAIAYTLRGGLSQLARPGVVSLLAGELAALFAQALAARLAGEEHRPPQRLPLLRVLLGAGRAWLLRFVGLGPRVASPPEKSAGPPRS